MRVLWICNIVLPVIAKKLGQEVNNKEGWISGLMDAVLAHNESEQEKQIQLGIAFPIPKGQELLEDCLVVNQDYDIPFYGFREDVTAADWYDNGMEADFSYIFARFKPDVIHCFGTEYPHTLAAVKTFGRPERSIIGIQGLCRVYAGCYMANLPKAVQKSVTFRDWLKKDTLPKQQQKFEERGQWELAAVKGTGHVIGRTHWDKYWTGKWNPRAKYHMMNETLRKEFYIGQWSIERCQPHRLFLSQGDYPIKGLHYMLLALPQILKEYPDTRVYVAGNSILRDKSLVGRLKISAYGAYIERLIDKEGLGEHIHFAGKLNAAQMKEQYLACEAFVCPSSIENSPNSLGEAMILGVPVVTSDVGGICTMITPEEGILYEGFRTESADREEELYDIAERLAKSVCQSFSDREATLKKAAGAKVHADKTHNGTANNRRLIEIYEELVTSSS